MTPDKHALLSFLERVGALRFGRFTLKSGDTSPFFVNLGDVASGAELDALGAWLAGGLDAAFPDATHLYGPPYKAISLATAAAVAAWRERRVDLGVCFSRKEAKAHGEGGTLIGRVPGPQDRVVIVDDVLSSGGAKLEAVEVLRGIGVEPVGVLVVVDRRRADAAPVPGLPPVAALATIRDLADFLDETDPAAAAAVRAFHGGAR